MNHIRDEDIYERPSYPVDEPPTYRARCGCGWTGPSRYRGFTDRDFDEHRRTPPPEPRTAPAATQPCELYAHTASPVPMRTQFHHSRCVYLQNRLYGQIRYGADLWVCGTCHDNLHETISWLLGEGRKPNPMPGRKTLAEAQRTVQWYRQAMEEKA